MKESLRLFGVSSAGFEDSHSTTFQRKSDDDISDEASCISDLAERESYLRKQLEGNPLGYVRSKHLLSDLIKAKDPEYACDLIFSASRCSPAEPKNFLLFAKVAIEHKAWLVAKSSLDVTKWICAENHGEVLAEAESLICFVNEEINKKETDNSSSEFWSNKFLDKFWLLERLYYQFNVKKVIEYAFKLLKIFPNDIKNYEVVYRIFSQCKSKEAIMTLISYINQHLQADKVNHNLYLAMCYHYLMDFDTSIDFLKKVLALEKRNSQALFYLSLNYLMKAQLKEFVTVYESILPTSREPAFIAVHFVSCAAGGINLGTKEFPNQKAISKELSMVLERLIESEHQNTVFFLIEQFNKLNYHLILPFLRLYIAELFIRKNMLQAAKTILKECSDEEVHRLNAWIYRLEGKEDLAEEELMRYRKHWIPGIDSGVHCQGIDLNLPEEVPNDLPKVFQLLQEAYKETKDLIKQIDLEYGVNTMTCIETGCQDCCKKTFPYVSFTEYLYMKNWLDKQTDEYKAQIYESSKQIVNRYQDKFKKEPPFLSERTIDSRKEYPLEFRFDCPFLGDNKCNVYEARPYTCRAYGYGSSDGISFKGCSYFYEQIKGATKLNSVRKVLDMTSFYSFTTKADTNFVGKPILAPIPVWFSRTYEENLALIKNLSKG